MLHGETAKVPEMFEALRRSLFDLVIFAPLAGLTILGEAIHVREDLAAETMETDGVSIFYNPEWVRKKGRKSCTFDLLHEWLHIFGNHPRRCGARDPKTWNYACDVRVAHDALAILQKAVGGWVLEKDHVPALPWAETMTVEEIYDELLKRKQTKKLSPALTGKKDEEAPEKSDANGVPLDYKPDMRKPNQTPADEERFLHALQGGLMKAKVAIESAKKGSLKELYGPSIEQRFTQIQQGGIPWGRILQGRIVEGLGRETASWTPPSFRLGPTLPMPSSRSSRKRELVLAIDVSASIDAVLLNIFASNVVPAACRARKVTIITFDAVIREVIETTNPGEILRLLKFTTGAHSHTSTVPVFEMIEERQPDSAAFLTDGIVQLPTKPWHETIWVIPEGGPTMSWGRTVHMQLSW